MDPAKPQNIARERWLILRNALLNKRLLDASSCSVTRHNTTALFSIEKLRALKTTSLEEDDWLEYRMSIDAKIDREAVTLLVKQPRAFISKQDLSISDNTGNVCIWASEQAMAYFILANLDWFDNSSVIELGGGCSCLAGAFLAKYGNTKRTVVSDGNLKATKNVIEIAKHNRIENMEVIQLQWNDQLSCLPYIGSFDYVLVADCLFKDGQRHALAHAIHDFLKDKGEGIVFAPKRGKTLDDFVSIAKKIFGDANVTVTYRYNEEIWKYHQSKLGCVTYDEAIHYPIYIRLKKF